MKLLIKALVTKVSDWFEKWTPLLMVMITALTVGAVLRVSQIDIERSKETKEGVAELCVQAWKDREDLRHFVIDASRETASAPITAILNTLQITGQEADPEQVRILREQTEAAVGPAIESISKDYPDPDCDLQDALDVLQALK